MIERLARMCCVFTQDQEGLPNVCRVELDRVAGLRLAVEHLVQRARQRIGLAVYSTQWRTTEDRLRGYREGLKSAGRAYDDRLVWSAVPSGNPVTDPLSLQRFAAAAIAELVQNHHADALILPDDRFAAAAYQSLQKAGLKVPQDVAVLSFDYSSMSPLLTRALTAIDQKNQELAQKLIDLLIAQIEGLAKPGEGQVIRVVPELIPREST
jgi:DNA-binding LacI/PurR family transcriptional regulator